jgi:hypothetical protein
LFGDEAGKKNYSDLINRLNITLLSFNDVFKRYIPAGKFSTEIWLSGVSF